MENVTAFIMAAKKDDRMKSKKSKFAQMLYGKEVIKRVVEQVKKAGITNIYVIVGKENRDEIKDILKEEVNYIYQETCLGSGHAIMQAEEYLRKAKGKVVILNGNIPLIQASTIQRLVQKSIQEEEKATVLTAIVENPNGYGRIIRKNNKIKEIIEEIDLADEQRNILEVNSGIYCFEAEEICTIVKQLEKNKTGLYNLTDVIKMIDVKGLKIGSMLAEDNTEILAVHNKQQLEMLARILRIKINTYHMEQGVTIEDITNTYIYDDVEIGIDTIIRPNTTIKSGVIIGEDCDIGPNAYIREGCKLANKAKVGSFVEIKKAIIGEGTKVPHLSYMGDCEIGARSNIGCGTITCNYDGFHKSKTIIGEHAFIGSNTNLVAPVTLGNNVFVAAGSTITEDIPTDALAIARQRQTNKEGWNKK